MFYLLTLFHHSPRKMSSPNPRSKSTRHSPYKRYKPQPVKQITEKKFEKDFFQDHTFTAVDSRFLSWLQEHEVELKKSEDLRGTLLFLNEKFRDEECAAAIEDAKNKKIDFGKYKAEEMSIWDMYTSSDDKYRNYLQYLIKQPWLYEELRWIIGNLYLFTV